jgi:hypothetical protein
MNPHDSKAAVRSEWHAYIQNKVGTVSGPPSPEWQHWILLQQATAKFGKSFHGALAACYKISPEALSRCVAALESGHESVARQIAHTGTFFGSGS